MERKQFGSCCKDLTGAMTAPPLTVTARRGTRFHVNTGAARSEEDHQPAEDGLRAEGEPRARRACAPEALDGGGTLRTDPPLAPWPREVHPPRRPALRQRRH